MFCLCSGRISPHSFEMFSISPYQVYSFRCWFSYNSVLAFVVSVLSQDLVFTSVHDIPFFRSGGIVMFLSSPIIPFLSKIMFFPFAYPFNWSVVSFIQVLSSYQVLPPSQPECRLKSFLPLVPFFLQFRSQCVVDFIKYLLILSNSCSIPSIYSRSAARIISFLFLLYLVSTGVLS